MPDLEHFSLFHLYRWILVVLGVTYATALTIAYFWNLHLQLRQAGSRGQLVRRYLLLHILRLRLRRFWLDVVEIVVLVAILWELVALHSAL